VESYVTTEERNFCSFLIQNENCSRLNKVTRIHCTSVCNKPVHNIHLPTLQELQHSCPMGSGHKWDFHSSCQSLSSLLLHSRRTHAREVVHEEREGGMPFLSITNSWKSCISHAQNSHIYDSLICPSYTILSDYRINKKIKTNASSYCEKQSAVLLYLLNIST